MDESGLDYVWTIAMHQHGKHGAIYKYKILACWKPYLWYSKGARSGGWVMDWIAGGGRKKKNHVWEDNPKMFVNLINRLTSLDSVILDTFSGKTDNGRITTAEANEIRKRCGWPVGAEQLELFGALQPGAAGV
jgi:hypothetical protein